HVTNVAGLRLEGLHLGDVDDGFGHARVLPGRTARDTPTRCQVLHSSIACGNARPDTRTWISSTWVSATDARARRRATRARRRSAVAPARGSRGRARSRSR